MPRYVIVEPAAIPVLVATAELLGDHGHGLFLLDSLSARLLTLDTDDSHKGGMVGMAR